MSDSRVWRVLSKDLGPGVTPGGSGSSPQQGGDTEARFEAIARVHVQRVGRPDRRDATDWVAVEQPLEIRLGYELRGERARRSISITMRTPGNDVELAAGFLVAEGILRDRTDIAAITPCGPPGGARNAVRVELRPGLAIDLSRLERHSYTSSSCGVCGKTSIDALRMAGCPALPPERPPVRASVIRRLPSKLRERQSAFDATGGLHAAALFTAEGTLVALHEDVGRHNAVDKLIGSQLLAGLLPRDDAVMLVSGRASFELVQKCLMAGVPILAAVGAPSSLAVELAARFGMTLLGFVRASGFNIYTGDGRIDRNEPG